MTAEDINPYQFHIYTHSCAVSHKDFIKMTKGTTRRNTSGSIKNLCEKRCKKCILRHAFVTRYTVRNHTLRTFVFAAVRRSVQSLQYSRRSRRVQGARDIAESGLCPSGEQSSQAIAQLFHLHGLGKMIVHPGGMQPFHIFRGRMRGKRHNADVGVAHARAARPYGPYGFQPVHDGQLNVDKHQ